MQELKPRDMSLPERVGTLERRLEKSENKRKILLGLVLEMIEHQHMHLTAKGKEALMELDS
jgi:hypothetical protein